MAVRRSWVGWVFALLVFAVAETGYLFVVPPWEAPDEKAHLRRSIYEAGQRQWPPLYLDPAAAPVRLSFYPPLYYGLAARLVRSRGADPDRFVTYAPHEARLFVIQDAASPEYVRLVADLMRLRWLGFLLSLGTAGAVGLAVRAALPRWKAAPILAILGLAAVPQVAFMGAMANPETLANILSAVATALVAGGWATGRWSTPRCILLGLVIGACILTKTTALYWAGLVPLAVALRHRWGSRGEALRELLLVGLPCMLVVLPWVSWTWTGFHDPLAIACAQAGAEGNNPPSGIGVALKLGVGLVKVLDSAWAAIGQLAVYGHWMLPLVALVMGVALLGVRRPSSPMPSDRGLLAWAVLAVALNLGLVLAYNLQIWSPQGRYLFLSLGALAIVVLSVAGRFPEPGRTRWGLALVGALLLQHIVFFLVSVVPVYRA